jgi:hypothetical protein
MKNRLRAFKAIACVGVLVAAAGCEKSSASSPSHAPTTTSSTSSIQVSNTTTTTQPHLPTVLACGDTASPPSHRPSRLLLDCDSGHSQLLDISWSSWTRARAVGSGTLDVDSCDPDCVVGRFIKQPALVVLSQPRDTDGRLLFTLVTVDPTAAGSSPFSDCIPADCLTPPTTLLSPSTTTTAPVCTPKGLGASSWLVLVNQVEAAWTATVGYGASQSELKLFFNKECAEVGTIYKGGANLYDG